METMLFFVYLAGGFMFAQAHGMFRDIDNVNKPLLGILLLTWFPLFVLSVTWETVLKPFFIKR